MGKGEENRVWLCSAFVEAEYPDGSQSLTIVLGSRSGFPFWSFGFV